MDEAVKAAVSAFQNGMPVCLFDSEKREGETDLLFPGQNAVPETMRQLRMECGGLLFLAIGHEIGELFSLPFLQDLHTQESLIQRFPVLNQLVTNDLRYDARSAFTLSLNHRETYTGITDHDRALTTRRFAELSAELTKAGISGDEAQAALGKEFRTPGHIPVCRETEGGLSRRQGHTELAVGLSRLAGMTPVVIGAEMLQSDGDYALAVDDARIWANERGIPFLEGAQLIEALNMQ
ncbi:MAG: 3,4-dihydroxy-2-butanone-4-phosphate synthase [Euryarchaeota archaeon]|jgi:3,4-dihydroxy 2-butanone 4-phosphate synthase|nr:3,4-dihydroxy-2-butanone-4-phosphate synthase [Euryarchaeota archaeon]MBT5594210.1 3,4-dihydroxy-2-butanone-4-phosphate synthase [Euryarchaeota archaeon]MBT5844927.1 3,4-dihydroxy-2-butanone-4-phosphate synthase [Euryarchaeota archaeon]MBT6640523.1 3,4-dihydroxy-2-butanone-4-phosphate synthase [Euryarchaeota archaeon]MBT6845706.1 3,4-dihydroxy-2-butanone-4-phosphate synthase [Euryarchaeota archaeon]